MRIIYLHQYFNDRTSSSSTRSFEMAKRLAMYGHDVHVVSTSRDLQNSFRGWRTELMSGFSVHRIYVPYGNSMSLSQRLRAFAAFALRAGFKARRLRGDVVYASSTPLTIALPARVATAMRASPQVFEVRDLWPEAPIAIGALRSWPVKWLAYALQRFAYRSANHIVALSPDMKDGVLRRGVSSEAITVIPNSSDLDLFDVEASYGEAFRAEHAWLRDRPLALYAGTLGRVNDVRYIVKLAHASLERFPDLRFLIVGRGAERDLVAQAAREARVLGHNLHMLEPVAKTALPEIYSAATVVFSTVAPVPELAANSANKVFDAFAAGRPVAINHEGWQAELLRGTGAGVVLDPYDIEGAVDDLAALVFDRRALRGAGEAAKKLAVEEFARDQHAADLAEVLERAVAERRGIGTP